MLTALVTAAICDRYAVAVSAAPPAVLTAALARRYPDNADVDVVVSVGRGRSPVSVRVKTFDPALRTAVRSWATASSFTKRDGCEAGAAGQMGLTFFPGWTGALGYPHATGGVNFDSLDYGRGPCSGSDPAEFKPEVEQVFAGTVSGRRIALVQLRCQFPIGFNAEVRAFRVAAGKAIFAGTLATFAYPAPDDPYVEHGWLHVRFANGLALVDAWQYFNRCRKGGDWKLTAYRLVGGRLIPTISTVHHRTSVAAACD